MARVLLADDDEDFRYMALTSLHTAAHDVVEVSSGMDALKSVHEAIESGFPFDVVIMDLNMPGWNGDEVVYKMTEIKPRPHIVLCTGQSDDPILNYADSMGFDSVLVKPFTLSTLRETVQKLMDRPTTKVTAS